MANNFDEIRKENRILMMENAKLPDTPEGKKRSAEIKTQLESNNRDLRAFADAITSSGSTSRLDSFRQKKQPYNGPKP